MSDKPETCIRRRITVDGANFYILVGREWATVTGSFENRVDQQPVRAEGSRLINDTIREVHCEYSGGEE